LVGIVLLVVAVLIILLLVWPAVAAANAGRKRHMENAWMWGFGLSWVGVMIVNSRPIPEPPQAISPYHASTPQTKICPRCAETVKAAATVCRFCGHTFQTDLS
jgi:hypothetical protein